MSPDVPKPCSRTTAGPCPHMDGCTVGFDRPRLHHSREGINPIYLDMLAHLFTPGLGVCRTRECELGHSAQADSGRAQKVAARGVEVLDHANFSCADRGRQVRKEPCRSQDRVSDYRWSGPGAASALRIL